MYVFNITKQYNIFYSQSQYKYENKTFYFNKLGYKQNMYI